MSVSSDQLIEAPKMGRSLWDDARDRLLANKAAVTSLIVLAVITLLSVVGPMLAPHPYDQVFRDYVKTPASLEAYPKQDQIEPTFATIAKRARMKVASYELKDDQVVAIITSRRKVDERYARYFDRSDLFENAAISSISADKKSATITADVQYTHFFFGTDANGRDMLSRTLIAGRVSLTIGLLATFVAISIGCSGRCLRLLRWQG